MPYRNISELPQSVREAIPSYAGRAMFRAVVNNQLKAGKSESVSFASAWAALHRAGYKKSEKGVYIKKSEESPLTLTAERNAEIRDSMITNWNLGPESTAGANDDYWNKLAKIWSVDQAQARRQLCANCEYFDNTPEALSDLEHIPEDKFDADGGGRGFCEKFDFICHNLRTCQAWEEKESEDETESEDENTPVPLYGYRPLLNSQELIDWAKANGYTTTLLPEDMHVTLVYSKTPLPMPNTENQVSWGLGTLVVRGGNRKIMSLGDGSASALVIDNTELISEWNNYRSMGASWDWPSFMPHVTISYSGGPTDIEPFTGDLVFGPIQFEPIKDSASLSFIEKQGLPDGGIHAILKFVMDSDAQYSSSVKILKMDDEQRVVWGWASVATENGTPVFDSHGDHIPMSELTKASIDFMENIRVGKSLHHGDQVSAVIGCLPLSQELAKALGIQSDREGLIMGFRVHDDQTWNLIKSGDLPALSIGARGRRYAV